METPESLKLLLLLRQAARHNPAEEIMETPESLKPHEPDYRPDAWQEYTLAELGWWVHLLVKRASMRADPAKREKDLYDARNYLAMMQSRLDDLRR